MARASARPGEGPSELGLDSVGFVASLNCHCSLILCSVCFCNCHCSLILCSVCFCKRLGCPNFIKFRSIGAYQRMLWPCGLVRGHSACMLAVHFSD